MEGRINWTALGVFIFFFALVTVMGFLASRWQSGKANKGAHLDEWWHAAQKAGHVTAADVVYGRYLSRPLEFAIALTGVVATMPYIALQLVGMEVVIKALGLTS